MVVPSRDPIAPTLRHGPKRKTNTAMSPESSDSFRTHPTPHSRGTNPFPAYLSLSHPRNEPNDRIHPRSRNEANRFISPSGRNEVTVPASCSPANQNSQERTHWGHPHPEQHGTNPLHLLHPPASSITAGTNPCPSAQHHTRGTKPNSRSIHCRLQGTKSCALWPHCPTRGTKSCALWPHCPT